MTNAVISKFPTAKVRVKAAISRATTTVKTKSSAALQEVKSWGIGEWGSIASMLGVGLWVIDKKRKK